MEIPEALEESLHETDSVSNEVDPEAPTQIQYTNDDSQDSTKLSNQERESDSETPTQCIQGKFYISSEGTRVAKYITNSYRN